MSSLLRRLGLLAFFFSVGLLACGDDDGSATDTTPAGKGGSSGKGGKGGTGGKSGSAGKGGSAGQGSAGGSGGAAAGSGGALGGKGGSAGANVFGGGGETSSGGQGGSAGSSQGGGGTAPGFATAPHNPPPQMKYQGGPVVKAPHLVTVSFKGYTDDADLEAYGDWIVQSGWLETVGKDYGVGKGTHTHAALAQQAPAQITAAGLDKLVGDLVNSKALPAPGSKTQPDTIYLLVMPEGTTLEGFSPCSADNTYAGAYHSNTDDGLVYGVVGQCPGAGFNPVAFAHEFIEAATDPFPGQQPAYVFTTQYNGEIADFCGSVFVDGHFACRVWSNSAATAGIDPCIPGIAEPYYSVSVEPQPEVIKVTAGQSIKITLTGWSMGPVDDWDMVTDVQQFSGKGPAKVLPTATVSPAKINNGKTATLTIEAPAGADKGIHYDVGIFMGYLPPAPPSKHFPDRHFLVQVQ